MAEGDGTQDHQNQDHQVHILKSIKDTELDLDVVLMEKEFSIGQLVALNPGSVLPFGVSADTPASIQINGKTVVAGTVVQSQDHYGLEVKDVLSP